MKQKQTKYKENFDCFWNRTRVGQVSPIATTASNMCDLLFNFGCFSLLFLLSSILLSSFLLFSLPSAAYDSDSSVALSIQV
jgi:hypothetical protein